MEIVYATQFIQSAYPESGTYVFQGGLRPSLEGQGPRDQMLRYRLRTPTWNDTMRPNFARYITAFGQESSKSGFTTPPNCMGLFQRRKKFWNPKEFGGYKYVRSYQLT